MISSRRLIFSVEVSGVRIDNETRCAHYHGENDIIAIKFKCCGKWFSCYECHTALADHPAEVWPKKDFAQKAILCGGCGRQLSATEYSSCNSKCPRCHREFNPGCANHRDLYFE
ncbi:MAG: CHY zinc finger protein [Verrucomicrobiota bacterium]